jgi:hypothetical protein
MNQVTNLLCGGRIVPIGEKQGLVETLEYDNVDGLVVEGLWGFNDLGGFGGVIAQKLGVSAKQLRSIGEEIEPRNGLTIVGVKSRVAGAKFKGIALVPTQNSVGYRERAVPLYGRPYRDFYYNVAYEAMALLIDIGCKDIAIAGITGSEVLVGDPDIGNCVAEAIVHIAQDFQELRTVCSVGNGPRLSPGIDYFNRHPEQLGSHREIAKQTSVRGQVVLVTLELPERRPN